MLIHSSGEEHRLLRKESRKAIGVSSAHLSWESSTFAPRHKLLDPGSPHGRRAGGGSSASPAAAGVLKLLQHVKASLASSGDVKVDQYYLELN